MITVHHLNNSRSQRVLWLLEELSVPYEIKRYERNKVTMLAPPELLAVHPLGKSPVITDDGRTIAETGAIVEYLIERHGDGKLAPPAGSGARLRYSYWLHFAEGSAMPPLVMKLFFTRIAEGVPFLIRPIAQAIVKRVRDGYVDPTIAKQLDMIEAELGRNEWFAGDDFTAADVMMSFPMEAAKSRVGLDGKPKILGWLDRIHARPAYAATLAKGGPYAYAK